MVRPEWHLARPRVRPSGRHSRSKPNVVPEVLPRLSGTWPVRKRGVSILAYAISERLERAGRSGAGAPERGTTQVNFRDFSVKLAVNFFLNFW